MAKRSPGKKSPAKKTLNTAAVRSKVARAKISTAVHDKPRLALAEEAPAENTDQPVEISAHEAIAEVAALTNNNGNGAEPAQTQLFDLAKPFNFPGALEAIASKNRDVKFARQQMDDAKETYSHRRKTWERETEQLQTLIDTLEARERQVRQDFQARAEQSIVDSIAGSLHEAGWRGIGADVVKTWTEDQRDAALHWIDGEHDRASVPELLGVPHVAAGSIVSETPDKGQTSDTYQSCQLCGSRLVTLGDGIVGYPMGTLVGFSCTESVTAPAHLAAVLTPAPQESAE